MSWTIEEAIDLCRILEPLAAEFDCHIALTGGLLYKNGPRKDCDIVIYRRGRYKGEDDLPDFNKTALLDKLHEHAVHLVIINVYSRVTKAIYNGKPVDLLFVNTTDAQGEPGDST